MRSSAPDSFPAKFKKVKKAVQLKTTILNEYHTVPSCQLWNIWKQPFSNKGVGSSFWHFKGLTRVETKMPFSFLRTCEISQIGIFWRDCVKFPNRNIFLFSRKSLKSFHFRKNPQSLSVLVKKGTTEKFSKLPRAFVPFLHTFSRKNGPFFS